MPLCSFEGDASLFGSTPVENLFLQEIMLGAPGDYVKVYLYGLMQAHYPALAERDLDRFAASLGMERPELDKALAYWQKRNLIRVEKGRELHFVNVRNAMFGGRMAASEKGLYEYAAFSNRLDELAAESGRPWKKREPAMLYDLLEDGFEEEALFLLLQDALGRHGKGMTSARLNALVQEWRQKNLRNAGAAREEILGVVLRSSPANAVLVKMGITQRKVSEAEHLAYEKWTGEWGFDQAAIFAVLQDMTGVQSPNFKYLDRVLSTRKKQGQTSAGNIQMLRAQQEQLDEKIRDVAHDLGAKGSVSDAWREAYHRWTAEYGLEEQVIRALAKELNAEGIDNFKDAESRMASAARRGAKKQDGLARQRRLEKLARQMHEKMGLKGKLTEREIDNAAKWREAMPESVLLYGAECAADAQKPLGYLARIMGEWQRAGVQDVKQAEAEQQKLRSARAGQDAPSSAAYADQRQYGDERDALFETFGGSHDL